MADRRRIRHYRQGASPQGVATGTPGWSPSHPRNKRGAPAVIRVASIG
ncbi:hypothetical protein Rhow_005554 [Rhodococcus wratislaviensis]|uniref:Uncharacterized protein n=1 Tax=Rhodococcus wratislaviensis TaxID=44752 RepID=A0A402CE64_RHOWR|nr:hypothetical protein Rhow_005554 [Rhodococcus wratislaviensis]